MADLIDRLSGHTTRPKINTHRFVGVERLYALGEWSRSEIATEFDLQGDEATQATDIADEIDSYATATEKMQYILRIEAIAYCMEDKDDNFYHNQDGSIDKTKVYEDLLL